MRRRDRWLNNLAELAVVLFAVAAGLALAGFITDPAFRAIFGP